MTKNSNSKSGKHITQILEIFAFVVFLLTIYLAVRWCEYPLLFQIKLFEILFIPQMPIDAAIMNLVTGYFTGYLVYLLTVEIPTIKKNKLFAKQVSKVLIRNYNQSMYLLFLMVKSISTEPRWNNFINRTADLECFDEQFYEEIQSFDVMAQAESLFDNEKNHCYWYNYLELNFARIYEQTEDALLKYHSYLKNDFLECIDHWKHSALIDKFLGNGNRSYDLWKDIYGKVYMESFPLSKYYEQLEEDDKPTPLFHEQNQKILKEYVLILEETYKLCVKYLPANDKQIDPAHTIKLFEENDIGSFYTSRL